MEDLDLNKADRLHDKEERNRRRIKECDDCGNDPCSCDQDFEARRMQERGEH